MKTKKDIVENWLPRYTGLPLDKFGKYIILTNFSQYLELFAEWHSVPIVGEDHPCLVPPGRILPSSILVWVVPTLLLLWIC